MDKNSLAPLERLNQLSLTETEEENLLAFFDKCEKEMDILNAIDTENVERMVHVMPLYTVVREDVHIKKFERDDLQKGAPEAYDGYWQVPRLVE